MFQTKKTYLKKITKECPRLKTMRSSSRSHVYVNWYTMYSHATCDEPIVIHQTNLFGCALHVHACHHHGVIYHIRALRVVVINGVLVGDRRHPPTPPCGVESTIIWYCRPSILSTAPDVAPNVSAATNMKYSGPLPPLDMVHISLITYTLYFHMYW
jgi:hypothetical protein